MSSYEQNQDDPSMVGGHLKVRRLEFSPLPLFIPSPLTLIQSPVKPKYFWFSSWTYILVSLQYAQGTISSTIGYETGEQTKQSGLQEMRDAKAQDTSAPAQSGILGTVETMAGKAVGCEGMEKEEGKARKPTGGIEEQSGTG
jgi:hypothetical protein